MILLHKAILIIISIIMMFQADVSIESMCIISLIMTTLSALDYYFADYKYKLAYLIVIALLCINNSDFCYFIPLVVYDTSISKFYYLNNLLFIIILIIIDIPVVTKSTIIFISILAFAVYYYYQKYSALYESFYDLQDQTNEMEMTLINQNKQLIDSQDNEVYYATLNERGRIAREIHDNVGHILSSSIIQLGAIKKVNSNLNLDSLLEQLDLSLNDGMNSIRSSVHRIHAQSLDLEDELNKIIKNYLFCKIQINYDISEFVPTKIKTTILSIVREALNNTAKHSNATLIKISIRELEKHYQVIINDNGNIIVLSNNGLGLSSMKERIDSLNGLLHINTDDGFKIHITIPKE